MKKTTHQGQMAVFDALIFFTLMLLASTGLYTYIVQDVRSKDWRHELEMNDYVSFSLDVILRTITPYDENLINTATLIEFMILNQARGEDISYYRDTLVSIIDKTLRYNIRYIFDISSYVHGSLNRPERIDPPIRSSQLNNYFISCETMEDDFKKLIESEKDLYVSSSQQNNILDLIDQEPTPIFITLWIWEV